MFENASAPSELINEENEILLVPPAPPNTEKQQQTELKPTVEVDSFPFFDSSRQEPLSWSTIKKKIYNKKEKTILGRTGKQWLNLLLFYIGFYTCLTIVFAVCLQSLFYSLDSVTPKLILEKSIIGTNPGMGIRPMPKNLDDGLLIKYSLDNANTITPWLLRIEKYLNQYKQRRNTQKCNYKSNPHYNKVCRFDLRWLKSCSGDNDSYYGYDVGSPCIYIKLNKIYKWEPEPFTKKNLPKEMPADLRKFIYSMDPPRDKQIWVSCEPLTDEDRNNMLNETIVYSPRGFPVFYYPYLNQKDYVSPLVSVRVTPKPNKLVTIQCRAWAKNINVDKTIEKFSGATTFKLLVKTDKRP